MHQRRVAGLRMGSITYSPVNIWVTIGGYFFSTLIQISTSRMWPIADSPVNTWITIGGWFMVHFYRSLHIIYSGRIEKNLTGQNILFIGILLGVYIRAPPCRRSTMPIALNYCRFLFWGAAGRCGWINHCECRRFGNINSAWAFSKNYHWREWEQTQRR